MIGEIIGTIVGSVYEFGGIKSKGFPLFGDVIVLRRKPDCCSQR